MRRIVACAPTVRHGDRRQRGRPTAGIAPQKCACHDRLRPRSCALVRRGPLRSPIAVARPHARAALRSAAASPCRRWSSSTPRKAAAPARRPTGGCRSLKGRPDVVALAFHVDYWDRLGWKDRFASAAYSQRQAQLQAQQRRTLPSTRRRSWSTAATSRAGLACPAGAGRIVRPRPCTLRWRAKAQAYVAEVARAPGAPLRLAGYWARDRGRPCQRREGRREPRRDAARTTSWCATTSRSRPGTRAADAARRCTSARAAQPMPQHPRHVNLVVVDADSGRPAAGAEAGLLRPDRCAQRPCAA